MESNHIEEGKEVLIPSKQDITIPPKNVNKEDIRKYWDRDYINAKINAIKNPSHQMLFRFLWISGVRISEALGLKKGYIDFENYTIRIRWLKSRKYNERIVPLHPQLRNLLQLYSSSMLSDDKLFPISRQRAWQLCKNYLGGHPHQIRHSFAVNWLRCDGDLVTLHRMLGHSKIQTTMEYLKIVPIDQGKELMKVVF